MIRFRTLGVLDLRDGEGTELGSVLRQPKRLAVLAYLALAAPGGFVRRDRLLAMFWPEHDRDRGRHALSQAIHYLRRSLGRSVVVGRGDEELGIAPDKLWCDAVALRDALERGELEAALELYTGELLPGLFVDESAQFERWLDEERSALSKRAAAAAWTLAERSGAAGDARGAATWARQAVALAPWDEAGLRRLVALLDTMGDRAGAIEAYQDFARRLQVDLDVEPSAETQELIEAIRQRAESGDAAQVPAIVEGKPEEHRIALAGAPVPMEAAVQTPDAAALRPGQRGRRRVLGAVAATAVLALLAVAWPRLLNRPAPAPGPATEAVAVLYFHDQIPGGDNEFLPDALTTELIRQLHHEDKIEVISAQGVRQFRGRDLPVDSIANALNVSLIVSGTVTQSRDQLQVYVELADASDDGRIVDRTVLERPATALFSLVEDVSQEVASFLRPILGHEIRLSRWQAGTSDPRAWQLMKEAEELRLRSVDLARKNDFVGAWSAVERADMAAEEAARLDPRWPDPLVLRGWLAELRSSLCVFSGRAADIGSWLDQAEDLADHALDLDRRHAPAFELRGTSRVRKWLLVTPPDTRADSLLAAAESDLQTALNIDGTLPRAASNLSIVLYAKGEFEHARNAALRAYEADAFMSDVDELTFRLFSTSFELHDDDAASHWCDEVRRRMPDKWPHAYCDLVLLGWGDAAQQDSLARSARLIHATFGRSEAAAARELARPRLSMLLAASYVRANMPDSARALILRDRYRPGADIDLMEQEAAAWVVLGEPDSAIAVLDRYLELRPNARPRVTAGRFFEPIRKRLAGGDSR